MHRPHRRPHKTAVDRNHSNSRECRSRSSDPEIVILAALPLDKTASTICWYHRCYGKKYNPVPNPTPTTPRETNTADVNGGTRLQATGKASGHRFLIDTDSDLCVFLRKLVPQHRTLVNYDLCADITADTV
jgi:hypothetical protein